MKTLALPFFLFLACGQIYSQNYEHTDRWGEEIYGFHLFPDGSYFLAGYNGYDKSDFSISTINGDKIILQDYPSRVANFEFEESPTGDYFTSFYDISCDVHGSYIKKVDNVGNEFWQLGGYELYLNPGIKIAAFPDGELLYTQDTKLFKVDGNSDFIWDVELGQHIFDVEVDTGGYVYVALSNGVFKFDGNGIDLDIMSLFYFSDLMANNDGLLAAKNNDSIFIYNSNLEINSEYIVEPGQNKILEYDFSENHIAVLLGTDSSANAVEIYDLGFNEVGSFILDDEIDWEKIALDTTTIYLAGREFYGNGKYASVVKDFAFDGTTAEYHSDAAVTAVTIDSIGLRYWWFEILSFSGIEVEVENTGTDTLESFWVAVPNGFTMNNWCNYRRMQYQEYTDFALPPGESVMVSFADFDYWFEDSTHDPELNFFAYLPNRHLESDHSDNFFLFDFLVDAKEEFNKKLNLNISPNPTSDFLNIFSKEKFNDNMGLAIYDTYGKLVRKDFLAKNERQKEVDVSGFPVGVYFLKINAENRGEVFSEKIIVAN